MFPQIAVRGNTVTQWRVYIYIYVCLILCVSSHVFRVLKVLMLQKCDEGCAKLAARDGEKDIKKRRRETNIQ